MPHSIGNVCRLLVGRRRHRRDAMHGRTNERMNENMRAQECVLDDRSASSSSSSVVLLLRLLLHSRV